MSVMERILHNLK